MVFLRGTESLQEDVPLRKGPEVVHGSKIGQTIVKCEFRLNEAQGIRLPLGYICFWSLGDKSKHKYAMPFG